MAAAQLKSYEQTCRLPGPVWDTRQRRLYFVDISKNRLHTFEPHTGVHGFETFDSSVTFVALRKKHPGVLVSSKDAILLLGPDAGLPFPPTSNQVPRATAPFEVLNIRPLPEGVLRFNDGCVDPVGRLTIGTMESKMGRLKGALYSVEPSPATALSTAMEAPPAIKTTIPNIGCSNGTGWLTTPGSNQATMFYTDTVQRKVFKYLYDLSTGMPSQRQTFHDMTPSPPYPDGMCQDTEGGLWLCHWNGAAITRIDPHTAQITHRIEFPKCWNITCCVFGGDDLDVLYVTTASCQESGDRPQEEMPESGDLYAIPDLGFRGMERYRYDG